jgi:glycosyltransferase involved in cell wall biosynthesis
MKCSIVIACYNNPDLILETLRSIELQTYNDWELILVDDCSTDNTVAVLKEYIKSSSYQEKYKLILSPKNGGVSSAKGLGVEQATGDIIAICDHDDALAPEALTEVVKVHIQNPKASIVYTQHYNCDQLLRPVEIAPGSGHVRYSDILEEKVGHLLTFKRSAYQQTTGYDSGFKVADDKNIIYKLEEVGDVVFIEKPLYYFRISERGTSRGYEGFNKSRDEKLIAVKQAIARRKISGIKPISQQDYEEFLAEHYLLQAEGYILMQKPLRKAFFTSLAKAYYYRPTKSIYRKIKATLLLSRIKRMLVGAEKKL